MACKHEYVKCVNCVKYCMICGEKLPDDFFQKKAKKEKAAETPAAPEAPAVEPESKEATKKETKPRAKTGKAAK